jgi:hypothetical protein
MAETARKLHCDCGRSLFFQSTVWPRNECCGRVSQGTQRLSRQVRHRGSAAAGTILFRAGPFPEDALALRCCRRFAVFDHLGQAYGFDTAAGETPGHRQWVILRPLAMGEPGATRQGGKPPSHLAKGKLQADQRRGKPRVVRREESSEPPWRREDLSLLALGETPGHVVKRKL